MHVAKDLKKFNFRKNINGIIKKIPTPKMGAHLGV
jgi:hypothetical protein